MTNIDEEEKYEEIVRYPKAEKPCRELYYCPYGPLVENFGLSTPRNKYSCKVFGHTCPIFSMKSKAVDK